MRLIVDVADMKVSNNPEDNIITYSLGSCIGVAIFDPVGKTGGIVHYMLPDSSINPAKAKIKPYMFADTAVPGFFKSAYRLGAKKNRMKVVVAGGGNILDQSGFFNIGKRNYMQLKKIFFKNNVMIDHEYVGDSLYKTLRLELKTGAVTISTSKEDRIF